MVKKLLLTITLFITLPIQVVYAQTSGPSLTIAPAILDLDVKKEQTLTRKITITNNSSVPIPIKLAVHDYTVDEYGVPDYSNDKTKWSPKKWIEVEPSDFILDVSESEKVKLTITIPPHAEPGTHFATVMFKSVVPPEQAETTNVQNVAYIGAIVALNVQGKDYKRPDNFLELKNFTVSGSVRNRPVQYSTSLQNNDAFYHKVTGELIFTNIFGKESAVIPFEQTTIFPEKFRTVIKEIEPKLLFGRYKVDLYVESDDFQDSQSAIIWLLPTVFDAILFVIIVAISTILIIKRRNLKKAIQVFINYKK